MTRKLRVAIDCRIPDPEQGIGTAVLVLAKALSDSAAENQEYTFVVNGVMKQWLAPYIFGPCKIAEVSDPTRVAEVHEPARTVVKSMLFAVKRALGRIGPLRFIWQKLHREKATIPVSDGYVESHQFDLVHFPTQKAYLTELPSIYQPWDLQHLHYPQFFTKGEFANREREYRVFCDKASFVCVQAEWTKEDVIDHYQIPADKVVVIPWGSVFDAYSIPSPEATQATISKHGLPTHYFFYPARTWPHKNHEVIYRALQILKDQHGIEPHVYFSGSSTKPGSATKHGLVLDKLAEDLGITGQVHFLGFLSSEELQVIYRTATAMIFPSKFEGFGLPILEAFYSRLPVLSSTGSTLPEIARDGALYFDPDSPTELSALMKIVLEEPDFRQKLIEKGTLVLSQYSIKDTAASFQVLYAKTASLFPRGERPSSPPSAD